MGNIMENCCPSKENEGHPEKETDILLNKNFHDRSIKYFSPKEESTYILLDKVSFIEYTNLLIEYSNKTAINKYEINKQKIELSYKSEKYNELLSKDDYNSFIENQIIKLEEIFKVIKNDELKKSIFLDYISQIYINLINRVNYNNDNKSNVNEGKKYFAIAIGFIYCGIYKNKDKINFLFNTFKNDEGYLEKSTEFRLFLISCFLVPSWGLLSARNKIQGDYKCLKAIEENMLKVLSRSFEYKDSARIADIFISKLFLDKKRLSHNEFINRFIDKKEFGWIISPSGIRLYLEENNDKVEDKIDIVDYENKNRHHIKIKGEISATS